MERLATMTSRCLAIRETGITKDMSPETAKHIRFYNIWAVASSLFSLLFLLWGSISVGTIRPSAVIPLLVACLMAFVLILNKCHQYTLARVYGAVLAYAVLTLGIVLVLGQSYFFQFFILLAVMVMFIAFPPEESKFVHLTVLIGLLCFTITMLLYNPIIPIIKADSNPGLQPAQASPLQRPW